MTTAMTEAFLAAHRGGVFEGWRCTVDYSLSKPLNPDVLVGMEVTKLFDGDEYEGKIASCSRARRWWKIHCDDGDREQLNYRELVKLVKPPDLSKLQYETPVSEFESFMRTTGGVPTLKNNNAGAKPGEPEFFTLDSQEWCFITVFLVQDSKMPIQGAYILRDEFQVESRDLTLLSLREAYPTVRLSMEDIQSWIDASASLRKSPNEPLQLDPVIAKSVSDLNIGSSSVS
jgi:hypothetical protein